MVPGTVGSQATSGRFLVRMNANSASSAPTPVLALQMAETIDLGKWEEPWARRKPKRRSSIPLCAIPLYSRKSFQTCGFFYWWSQERPPHKCYENTKD
jgi:hypothetical protein